MTGGFDNIDWDAVSEIIRFPEQALWKAEQRATQRAANAPGAASAPSESTEAGEPAKPSEVHVEPERIAQHQPTRHVPTRTEPAERAAPRDPVTELSAALDAATSDEQRNALLAAAPLKTREQLWARSAYRKCIADVDAAIANDNAAFALFTARLEGAADDTARLAIIRGTDPAFIARWRRQRTDTEVKARQRYLALVADDIS